MQTNQFYNKLSPYYHLIYENWESSTRNQAKHIQAIIHKYFGRSTNSILDVSCGIGTQSLGLSELGYSITASDLSANAISRAKIEAINRKLNVKFSVADMRNVWKHHQKEYDIVISCDNSIPHLLNDKDILRAFQQFYKCTKIGGGCIITVRDYDSVNKKESQFKPYGIHKSHNGNIVLFQIWEFKGDKYLLSMYRLEDNGKSKPRISVLRTQYYAVSIKTLLNLMKRAGFSSVKRLDNVFYQPVLIGKKTNLTSA
jgi:SAM-dependent methyltransferase